MLPAPFQPPQRLCTLRAAVGQMSSSSARPRAWGHPSLCPHASDRAGGPHEAALAAELLHSPCARRCSLPSEPVAVTESLLCLSFPLGSTAMSGVFPAPLALAELSPPCPHPVPTVCLSGWCKMSWGWSLCSASRAQSCARVGTRWCLGEVWCHISACRAR